VLFFILLHVQDAINVRCAECETGTDADAGGIAPDEDADADEEDQGGARRACGDNGERG
jgi:hypothetical protein